MKKSLRSFTISLPGILALILFIVTPALYLAYVSLFDFEVIGTEQRFVGMANYKHLYSDSRFVNAFWRTVIYATSTVALQLSLGLLIALALTKTKQFGGILLCLILIPYALPTVIVTFLWRWLLNDINGVGSQFLEQFGMLSGEAAWFDKEHILITTVLVSVWQFFPFVVLLLYAALNSIPSRLYEQGASDGMTKYQRFWRITLPALAPILSTIAVLRLLWMATKFDTPWLLAGQTGTGRYVETIPIFAYSTTFESWNAGVGSAASMILAASLLVVVAIYLLLTTGRLNATIK